MGKFLDGFLNGADHPEVEKARLRLLGASFRLFGSAALAGSGVFAWVAFQHQSAEGAIQSFMYLVVALVLLAARPQRLWWAWIPCILVAVITLKSSVDNGIMFGVAGCLFIGFAGAIGVNALAGLSALTVMFGAVTGLALLGLAEASVPALTRMPVYWFVGGVLTLAASMLMRRLNRTFALYDQANSDLQQRTQELQSAKTELQQRVKQDQEIFGIISHELRAPAAAIHLIAKSKDPSDSQRSLLRRNSARLLRALGDMRMIVDPTAVMPMSKDVVEIRELLVEIGDQVSGLLGRSNIQLDARIDDLMRAPIQIDEFRLAAVLHNLVRNACLHSQGSQVLVSATRNASDWVLRVDDDGRGIPEDQIEAVFQAWGRGDTQSDGTGLGLTIAMKCCTELGGQLNHVPSTLGGACFEVRLPYVAAPLESQAPMVDHNADEGLRNLRVLMVDDDPDVALLTRRELRDVLDHLSVEHSPIQALEQLQQDPPDVLISDYFMPEMDGTELIRRARAQGFDGWIIGATGAVLFEGVHPMQEAGADCVVEKPLEAQKLKAQFAELVRPYAGDFQRAVQSLERA